MLFLIVKDKTNDFIVALQVDVFKFSCYYSNKHAANRVYGCKLAE